jgi:PKD repeat protein
MANLTILPLPFDIVVNLLETTTNSNISFNSTVNRSVGNYGFEYIWEFGDGAITNTRNTTHYYSKSGNYTANLTVKDNNKTIATKSLMIKINNVPPVAIAGQETSVERGGGIVQFNGQGTDTDGVIVKYEWDFDGNGVYDWASGVNGLVTYIYNNRGTYNATLKVTDDDGGIDTAVRVISVGTQNHAPTITNTIANRTTVNTSEQALIIVVASDMDDDDLIYSYSATGGTVVGNGSTAIWTASTIAGNYTTSVTVSDGNLTTTSNITIAVVNITQLPVNHAPIITSIIANRTTINVSEQITITVNATDQDNDTLIYNYSTTGGTIIGNGSVAIWTPPSTNNTYTITATVSDGDLTVTDSIDVSVVNGTSPLVINNPPTVSITSQFTGKVNSTIAITGTSSDDVSVQSVQIDIDDTGWITLTDTSSWLYSLNTTKLTDGKHAIKARAYDGALYSDEKTLDIDVKNTKETKKESGFIPAQDIPMVIATVGALAVAAAFFRRRNNK